MHVMHHVSAVPRQQGLIPPQLWPACAMQVPLHQRKARHAPCTAQRPPIIRYCLPSETVFVAHACCVFRALPPRTHCPIRGWDTNQVSVSDLKQNGLTWSYDVCQFHLFQILQCCFHGGRPGAGPDPNPPPTPPPLPGAKMFERSRPSYKPKWRNRLAPQAPENFGAPFGGAGITGHPCVYTQNAQFSSQHFCWAPKRAGFVQHF